MGEIYRDALFTISADGARDSSEGCFLPRTPQPFDSARLNLQLKDGNPCTIFFGPRLPTYNGAIRGGIDGVPLNDRGWTLQERLLSRRVLHYGKHEMFWECQESSVFEYGKRTEITSHWTKKEFVCNIEKNREIYNAELFKEIHRSWRDTVWAYTARKLTRDTDKLPALSGLAKTIHASTGDRYLTGIWAADLLDGLSWEAVPGDVEPITRPTEYRAPSWSWASVNGPVWYPDSVQGESCGGIRLIDAKIDMLGHDDHGQVTGGWIKITGSVYSAFSSVEKGAGGDYTDVVSETENVIGRFSFDVEGRVPGPVTCFLLRAQESKGRNRTVRTNVIVLEPTGIELDQFRRLGFGLLRGTLAPVVRKTIVIV
ncbi:MAG: hypothetical protein M1830_001711 [Pleopsidium flavum]|nr:MAG: hypothetical protein M1830_001711 [Pleopsidium flavum]